MKIKFIFKSPSVIHKEQEYGFDGRIKRETDTLFGGKNLITGVPSPPPEPLPYRHPIIEWNVVPRSYDNLDYLGLEFGGLTQEEIDSIFMNLGDGTSFFMDNGYYIGTDDYQYVVLDTNYRVYIDSLLNIDNSKIIGYETYTSFIEQTTIDLSHFINLSYIFLYGHSAENPNTTITTVLLPEKGVDDLGGGIDISYHSAIESLHIPRWLGTGYYSVNLRNLPNINSIIIDEIVRCMDLTVKDTPISSLDLTNVNFNTPATFGNYIWVQNNPNLTTVLFDGTKIGNIINFYLDNNTSLSSIDILGMPNLTNRNSNNIQLHNNNWNASMVNKVLSDLNTISVAGYTSRIIKIDGTNAAPDSSSGGYDGISEKNNLISKGFTVITN